MYFSIFSHTLWDCTSSVSPFGSDDFGTAPNTTNIGPWRCCSLNTSCTARMLLPVWQAVVMLFHALPFMHFASLFGSDLKIFCVTNLAKLSAQENLASSNVSDLIYTLSRYCCPRRLKQVRKVVWVQLCKGDWSRLIEGYCANSTDWLS